MTVQEIQRELAPKEDLTQYAGQWVALRDGFVVAHALDAVTLRENPDVSETDTIMPVSSHSSGVFVL
jgi:hypothetical protein